MIRVFVLLAALAGCSGVALGAFAAHGLKAQLSAHYLAVFQTAVHYQMLHALALLAVALLARHWSSRLLLAAGSLFVAGMLLFSGSLYALTLSGVGALGMITPVGGLCLMGGWLCLGLAALRAR